MAKINLKYTVIVIAVLIIILTTLLVNKPELFDKDCKNWRYENLNFLPCYSEDGFVGIDSTYLNKTLNPQENCKSRGYIFITFNTQIEERNKEVMDSISPMC